MELWTYKQTAEYLKISTRGVERLCKLQKIARVYLTPRTPRIHPKSVADYIDNLMLESYDKCAQDGECRSTGVKSWQKSIPAKTRRTGGQGTKDQMDKKLEALLAFPKNAKKGK